MLFPDEKQSSSSSPIFSGKKREWKYRKWIFNGIRHIVYRWHLPLILFFHGFLKLVGDLSTVDTVYLFLRNWSWIKVQLSIAFVVMGIRSFPFLILANEIFSWKIIIQVHLYEDNLFTDTRFNSRSVMKTFYSAISSTEKATIFSLASVILSWQ